MSFNYLEIARSVEEIKSILGTELKSGICVEDVSFCDFSPLPKLKLDLINDVCIGIRLERFGVLLLSLKAPWVGLFYNKKSTVKLSNKPLELTRFLKDSKLISIEYIQGDRVVHFGFHQDLTLTVYFFPARPTWVLTQNKVEIAKWRDVLASQSKGAFDCKVRDFKNGSYEYYKAEREKFCVMQLVQAALSQTQSRLVSLHRTRRTLESSLTESNQANALLLTAESLKQNLYQVDQKLLHQKLREIEISENSEQRIFKLDPKYTLTENVDRMFRRYKKLNRTTKEVEVRLKSVQKECELLTKLVQKLRLFDETSTFEEVAEFLNTHGVKLKTIVLSEDQTPKKQKANKLQSKLEKTGLKCFKSNEGLLIWIGRNHKENEELVIRLARGNDLWMHMKSKPGAHAIIQIPKNKTASLETMIDAATLVAHYSGVRSDEKAEVDYTFRKNIKRVPGKSDKFLVTYTQNKTLNIKVEMKRLERIWNSVNL